MRSRAGRRTRLLIAVALAAATLAAFSGVLRSGFVYDDRPFLVANLHVQGGWTAENVRWAWGTFFNGNWIPLSWLSHLLDVSMFGFNAAGHHFTNLAFHTINTLLLFFVLHGMTGLPWRSGLVAALFALHPLHVESVAWVSERKDLLSTFFFLLALAAYRRYLAKPQAGGYLALLLLFVLGLLSKPMLVTFPLVLLLLDWWPLGRMGPAIRVRILGRLVLEKLPFFAFSLAAGVITVLAQRSAGAMASWEALSPGARLANAAVSYLIYLGKTLWPASLAIFYPYPREGHPLASSVVALSVVAGLTFAAIRSSRRRPWLGVGWLWFAGTLVPVIGLLHVGSQALADRYTYIPLIGLFLAAVWASAEFLQRRSPSVAAGISCAAVVLLGCGILTWRQVGHWRDQRTVFEHAARVTASNYVAHFNLGLVAEAEGRGDEAIAHYNEAIRIYPLFSDANFKLGNALVQRGEVEAGIASLRRALRSFPENFEAWINLGVAEARLGRYNEAIASYRQALRLKPDLMEGHMNIGNALSDAGKNDEALGWYAQALLHGPGRPEAHFNLALTLERMGRRGEAAREYRETLRIQPDHLQASLCLQRVEAPPR